MQEMKKIKVTDEELKALKELGLSIRMDEEESKFNEPERVWYDSLNFKCENEKEAEQFKKETNCRNLLKSFSMANGGDKIDWEDDEQEKFNIFYSYGSGSYCVDSNHQYKTMNTVYFISKEVAHEARKRYCKELDESRGVV